MHYEFDVVLARDMKLHKGRPEYHHVTVDLFKQDNSHLCYYSATSMRMQRSSRLQSLQQVTAFISLPKAMPDHPIAQKGEVYTALLLEMPLKNNTAVPFNPKLIVLVKNAKHMNPKK